MLRIRRLSQDGVGGEHPRWGVSTLTVDSLAPGTVDAAATWGRLSWLAPGIWVCRICKLNAKWQLNDVRLISMRGL